MLGTVTPTAPVTSATRPGRPRSAATDTAILGAVRSLLVEHGYSGLTIEAVASRAGVAKTTLYRRWSAKADLVVDAVLDTLAPLFDAPAEAEPDELLGALVTALSRPEARAAFLALMAESANDPVVHQRLAERLVAPSRALVDRCADRSGATLDRNLLFDVVVGAVMHRVLVLDGTADAAFVRGLLDLVAPPPALTGDGPSR